MHSSLRNFAAALKRGCLFLPRSYATRPRRAISGAIAPEGLALFRQENREDGSAVDLGLNRYLPGMWRDKLAHDGEPKAGPGAGSKLGREFSRAHQ